ncbi:pilus assembly PilX N-terminal domain-containing protein [Rhodoferax sp. U2-2l]|uniref:pilus assembly PilX family protein n=1 Tax=Rhodoferax sp. U2-2l TaxID=2884000 RepID=UPI001D0ACC45|nr:pilus assembly PilX N-terminal domain-containing protein [Rhodoferax sp. U2-2l]MCB8745435.1 pilus assembly PilX N-terminal domain-containing protein [Rhodoferax sp. U2-2l]
MSYISNRHGRNQTRHHQRGAATLIVTMVFLFSISIVMLYLNRNVLFEQKTSASQMRSTKALEMAEAGIEWATGMLNAPYDINTACTLLTTTNISFRKKYVQTQWSSGTGTATDVNPALTTFPGCKINEATSAFTCNCPDVPNSTTNLGTDVAPSFTIVFKPAPPDSITGLVDLEAVQVTSVGCAAQAGTCTPASAVNSDASAVVSVILKLRPLLRAAPAAPLTCGTSCAVGGSYNIANLDAVTGGTLVNAGTTITQGNGTSYTTIPGQPVQNSLIGGDSTLAALSNSDPTCSNSAMFNAYFGSTISQYANSPTTKIIPNCNSANTCGGLVDTAYASGWRAFYFPDGFARNNSSGSFGSATDPVTIVSAEGFDINGNIDIYGMIFSNSSNVNDVGTGTADIHGAMVTCAGYNNNGNGSLIYDPTVLNGVRRATGTFVRVPGSWTDRCTLSTAAEPVLTCN